MSVGRTIPSVTALLVCVALATTASAALAQTGSDAPCAPGAPPPASSLSLAPSTNSSLSSDVGFLRLGLPLEQSASLLAFRWLAPAMGWTDARSFRAVDLARQSAARTAWWRKRF